MAKRVVTCKAWLLLAERWPVDNLRAKGDAMKPMATYIDTPPQSAKALTDAELSALLDGWEPTPPAGCGLTSRDMLLTAVENRVRLGRIALDGAGEG
jgi:hypothetical protein